jgi:hypothetical protein
MVSREEALRLVRLLRMIISVIKVLEEIELWKLAFPGKPPI